MKTILITGEPIGRAARINEPNLPIVVVDDIPNKMETLEINGIQYQKREEPRRSGRFNRLALMASMFSGMAGMGSDYKRPRPNVDIVEEFKLIQEKKSKLSRNDRDWIEHTFHRMYVPIEPQP